MDFLGEHAPAALPGNRELPPVKGAVEAPHGTTIVAVTFPGGVVLAGERGRQARARAALYVTGPLVSEAALLATHPASDEVPTCP